MVLGMTLATYTLVHVVISLIAILAGLVAAYGLLNAKRYDEVNALFLLMTVATSVTGFFFPFHGVTPAIKLGVISLIVLTFAILARYAFHLSGSWRRVYAITAMLALYLNVFVLVVQSFEKVPALHALAPTQKEPPFAIAQIVVLVLFLVLTVFAAKKSRA